MQSADRDGAKIAHLQDHFDRKARETRKLTGIALADMKAHVSDVHVVEDLFGRNSLIGIIGASGCGKTFLATNLSMHLAASRPILERQVMGGLVCYAALEGPVSAENRFVACRDHAGFPPGSPLVLTPGPINLRDPSDVAALLEFVQATEQEHGEKCVAVFVDTLSRAMSGGDENSSNDMGALIVGADVVRMRTGAAVFLIHHHGKDESRGARGHSSLKAALDTEVEVTVQGDLRVATITKQRDLPTGTRLAFNLEPVEIGTNAIGKPVTTCIVTYTEAPATTRKLPAGKNQSAMLAALQEWQREHDGADIVSSTELREIAKAQGLHRKRLQEVIEGLEKFGWVQPCVGGHRLLQETPK